MDTLRDACSKLLMTNKKEFSESIREPADEKNFLTVGIGASAGGLWLASVSFERKGASVWAQCSVAVLRNRKGNPHSELAIVVDIDKRKSLEMEQASIEIKAGGASQK